MPKKLQGFNNIIKKWQNLERTQEAAKDITLEQVEALYNIVNNDNLLHTAAGPGQAVI